MPASRVDYADGELSAGDVFLLASDGVWDTLGDARLAKLLDSTDSADALATAIANAATAAGAAGQLHGAGAARAGTAGRRQPARHAGAGSMPCPCRRA